MSKGPVLLKRWLSERTAKAEAKRLGIAPETMSRWASGKLLPLLMARWAIAALTGGVVFVDSWDQE